ncbi:MAG: hypothetical protein JF565_07050 [Propionibacteriales bacterium]|nr:hypothetical protein [Propionibacteriales bacterium]
MVGQLIGPVVPMHGLGGAKDLPIPAPLAIAGGTAALVVSFCVLVLAWRRPRYAGTRGSGRPLPSGLAALIDSDGWAWALRLLGLVAAGWFGWALVAGPDLVTNPVFGSFYVLLWVGIVPASLLFGRIFRALSPVRTINLLFARATGGEPSNGVTAYPAWLGSWPAAVGLFAFVWLELVNPHSAYIGPVRLWLAVYVAVMLIGSAVFGDTWLSRADPFEAYSDLLAKLSPWARREDGTLVWRSPLANLATTQARPGLVAMVAVLFGSTAFDSYKDTPRWVNFVTDLGPDVELLNTLALVAFCAAVGFSFTIATRTTSVDPETGPEHRALPSLLAHSVVPIIVGYMTAHYLSFFVEQGQTTLIQLSDPMVSGQNLLGTANWTVNYWLSFHPTVLASIKVLAVVIGHIVGVVAAHDRALELLPKKHQVVGQLGLLVIMVVYTATGLYLLFGS